MPLVTCPECGTQVSTAAAACPRCGYPVDGMVPAPVPAGGASPPFLSVSMLDVTRSIVGRVLVGAGMFATGIGFDAPPGVMLALVVWGSAVPLYLRARKAHRLGSLGAHREIHDAVQKQLTAARDETQRELGNVEVNSARIAELEERIDFMERLLARAREGR